LILDASSLIFVGDGISSADHPFDFLRKDSHQRSCGKLEKHEWEQLSTKVKNLEKAPLFIDDTPSLFFDLRAKARRLVSQHGIGIIIVDYLQ
jgi:replicative DNA helicase